MLARGLSAPFEPPTAASATPNRAGAKPLAPPPMPAQDPPKRRAVLHVRTTEEEAAKWRGKARLAGLTTSELLRRAMRRTRVWTAEAADEQRALVREVARIGANVNQIARWVNTYKDNADTARVLVHLVAIQRELTELRRSGGAD